MPFFHVSQGFVIFMTFHFHDEIALFFRNKTSSLLASLRNKSARDALAASASRLALLHFQLLIYLYTMRAIPPTWSSGEVDTHCHELHYFERRSTECTFAPTKHSRVETSGANLFIHQLVSQSRDSPGYLNRPKCRPPSPHDQRGTMCLVLCAWCVALSLIQYCSIRIPFQHLLFILKWRNQYKAPTGEINLLNVTHRQSSFWHRVSFSLRSSPCRQHANHPLPTSRKTMAFTINLRCPLRPPLTS